MKNLFLFYTILLALATQTATAQHIVDGSFEDNTAPNQSADNIDTSYFPNLKLLGPTGLRKIGGFYIKDCPGICNSGITWAHQAPDGLTYITLRYGGLPYSSKFVLSFSSPLTTGKYYIIRLSATLETNLTSLNPTDSITLELGKKVTQPTKTMYKFVPLDTNRYRTYACAFNADNNYSFLFISQKAFLGPSGPGASIDNIRLDTCVSVLPKRTISCVSFPFTLPTAIAGKNVYWNTGDTTTSISVSQNDVYIAQIYDSLGCVSIDSIEVNSVLINTPAVLTHKQLCRGDSLTLQSNFIGSYGWNTGDTSKQITVNDSGYYWVKTTFAPGCDRIDSFSINTFTPPALSLPKDTSFCAATFLLLNAFKVGYTNYHWNTGSIDSAITITQSGTYSVTYTNGVCSVKDSTVTHRIDIPQLNTDTSFCTQQSIVLIAPLAHHYLWNTGDTIQSIPVNTPNTYSVTKTTDGCSQTDTFFVAEIGMPTSSYSQQNMCVGSSIILRATPAQSYMWGDGSRDSILKVDAEGLYTVQKNNAYCMGIDSFSVLIKPLPIIVSLHDTIVCFDEIAKLLLDAGTFKSYLWQLTGETSRYIYSTKAQPYLLTVTDSNNCSASKQFDVLETCPDFIFVPTAFTPNDDGVNDVFLPVTRSLETYEMNIVNRWGQVIFTTHNTAQGWDGANTPPDVYVVWIKYQPKGKAAQTLSQNVTLLR